MTLSRYATRVALLYCISHFSSRAVASTLLLLFLYMSFGIKTTSTAHLKSCHIINHLIVSKTCIAYLLALQTISFKSFRPSKFVLPLTRIYGSVAQTVQSRTVLYLRLIYPNPKQISTKCATVRLSHKYEYALIRLSTYPQNTCPSKYEG